MTEVSTFAITGYVYIYTDSYNCDSIYFQSQKLVQKPF